MFCTKCGNILNEDDIFCGNCGEPAGAAKLPQAAKTQSAPLPAQPMQTPYSSPLPAQPMQTPYNSPLPAQRMAQPQGELVRMPYGLAYKIEQSTPGSTKALAIIFSIILTIMAFMPCGEIYLLFDTEKFNIFGVAEVFAKFASNGYTDGTYTLVAMGFIAAAGAYAIGCLCNLITIIGTASEKIWASASGKAGGAAFLAGSIIATLLMFLLRDDTYEIVTPELPLFATIVISGLMLGTAGSLRFGTVYRMVMSQENLVKAGKWRCAFCGRINEMYVGSCGCGHTFQETNQTYREKKDENNEQ